MNGRTIAQITIVVFVFFVLWLSIKVVRYLQNKKTDTEFWATVFEGATHNAIPQETLKEPEVYIEKKAKRDGQDRGGY